MNRKSHNSKMKFREMVLNQKDKITKGEKEWIQNILEEEDQKARPGTAAQSSGVSKLSKKYYEMTKATMKEKVEAKYFRNLKTNSQEKVIKKDKISKTGMNFYPYTTKNVKHLSFNSPMNEHSSLAGAETRTKSNSILRPQTAISKSGNRTRKAKEDSLIIRNSKEISVQEINSPMVPYASCDYNNIEDQLRIIQNYKSSLNSQNVEKIQKNK